MKRLFYLTESAEFAGQVNKQLLRIQHFVRHFHVLGLNEASVRKLLPHLTIQPVSETRSRVPVFN
ncbi:hypothetical protein [Litorivivens sp.]|uniref:hypothetical protein n=1 Tax=Litorivivens sp. TaxID=2020868 RepID=UPI0035675D65